MSMDPEDIVDASRVELLQCPVCGAFYPLTEPEAFNDHMNTAHADAVRALRQGTATSGMFPYMPAEDLDEW